MDNSLSQSDPEEEMSFEQKIFRDFKTDKHWGSHHRTFRQGLFTEGGGFACPPQRLVILSLGLLNAILLLAAVVIAIYCAKAQDGYAQLPHSAVSPFIIEMNYLRNHSDIIRAKLEAETALAKERANHVQLKLQVKQEKTVTDSLQGRIETLYAERDKLQSNKTIFEESCGRCRPGWTLLKSSCYYFSSKHVPDIKKNWADSRADCIHQGGDLLVINDLQEQQLMSDNFPKQSSSVGAWWQNGFWIGLTDVVTQGTWIWINNVTEVETMYWREGQPQNGNCAAMYYYSDTRKTWYNGNCVDHRYNWICEMEPN